MKHLSTLLSFQMVFIFFLLFATSCSKDKKTILDNNWQVISLKDDDDTKRIETTNTYVLKFEKKSFSIFLDVNSCGGDVNVTGNKISFSSAYCTEACCDTEFAGKIINILPKVKTYGLSGNELTFFTNKNGLINLVKTN